MRLLKVHYTLHNSIYEILCDCLRNIYGVKVKIAPTLAHALRRRLHKLTLRQHIQRRQRTTTAKQGQTDMRLLQRYIVWAEFQALAIDAIALLGVWAFSAQRKVPIPAVHQVEAILNWFILAADTATPIRLIDTRRNLRAIAGETAHLQLVARARVLRMLGGRQQTFTRLQQ